MPSSTGPLVTVSVAGEFERFSAVKYFVPKIKQREHLWYRLEGTKELKISAAELSFWGSLLTEYFGLDRRCVGVECLIPESVTMSREAMHRFLPATTVMLKKNIPGGFDYIFPEWILKQCPATSIELTIPGGTPITLRWPLLAVVILLGIVQGWATGEPLLNRALRKNQIRPGLFTWSFAFLWYAVMNLAGLFFHCFEVDLGFHLMDVIATGSASISIMAGFGAFFGIVDDRNLLQRFTFILTYLVLAGVALLGPDLLQEQLYLAPVFLAATVGICVITKCALEAGRSGVSSVQQAGFRAAKNWLLLAAVGFVIALAALPADKWLCVYLGAHFNITFCVFVGSNLSMWALYKFVLNVFDKNLHFTDLKRQ